jgi:hypothetical protein
LPPRIHKAALLMLALGAASIFAASRIFGSHEKLFECAGGNRYFLKDFNPVQEEEECFRFLAKLSAGNSGVPNIANFHNILPIDLSFPFLDLTLFPKALEDGRRKGLEGHPIAGLEFDSTDGLSVAPAPFAPGYYVGNPDIRREPGGNPLLFGCTNYRDESGSDAYNKCSTGYLLKNGDMLSYSFAGIKGHRPTNWANIDKAVRDLIEAAEQSALSR